MCDCNSSKPCIRPFFEKSFVTIVKNLAEQVLLRVSALLFAVRCDKSKTFYSISVIPWSKGVNNT